MALDDEIVAVIGRAINDPKVRDVLEVELEALKKVHFERGVEEAAKEVEKADPAMAGKVRDLKEKRVEEAIVEEEAPEERGKKK